MKTFDCIVCGTCAADLLVRPVGLLQPLNAGRLFHVEPIDVALGGIVCNAGTAMRRLEMRVAAASLVGSDLWGDFLRSHLLTQGIDSDALEVHPTMATSTTAVLIDPSGERSFAHHIGAPQSIDLAFVKRTIHHFGSSRLALIGYFGLLPSLEPVLAEALAFIRKTGCRIALETGGSGGTLAAIAPALPHIDFFVPSLDEAIQQTGLTDPREIISCYRQLGASNVVGVKLGTLGALLSGPDKAFLEIPCIAAPGPLADTTGAGDSFLAGLLSGVLRDMPLREAALLGAATAACCVTGRGATAGLRSLNETMKLVTRGQNV